MASDDDQTSNVQHLFEPPPEGPWDWLDGWRENLARVSQSTLFWGCLGVVASVVLTVVGAIVHDARWLLIVAWPFAVFAAWEFSRGAKHRGTVVALTLLGAVSSGVLLYAVWWALGAYETRQSKLRLDQSSAPPSAAPPVASGAPSASETPTSSGPIMPPVPPPQYPPATPSPPKMAKWKVIGLALDPPYNPAATVSVYQLRLTVRNDGDSASVQPLASHKMALSLDPLSREQLDERFAAIDKIPPEYGDVFRYAKPSLDHGAVVWTDLTISLTPQQAAAVTTGATTLYVPVRLRWIDADTPKGKLREEDFCAMISAPTAASEYNICLYDNTEPFLRPIPK